MRTSWTAPSNGLPTRSTPTFEGQRSSPVSRDEVRELVRVDRIFEPDPAHRETYDRLYAEFPGLYKAQRKMFSRLNG